MSTIALLGTGLLGAGFAQHMLSLGHTVRVWNRTPSRCEPLVALGAEQAATPAEAVDGVDYVHLVLAEDTAVNAVMETLLPALGPQTPVFDHSTNLPAGVAERTSRLRDAGVRYFHAPVFMSPRNAREGTGLMLIAGPTDEVAAHTPHLATLTGSVRYTGPQTDKAATLKIIGNGVMATMIAGLSDAFAIGEARGVSPDEVLSLFDGFNPPLLALGQRILADMPASFETRMAHKDLSLMVKTAGEDRLRLLPIITAALAEAVEDGRGDADFASVFRPPRA